ncbi:CopG family antitoxin [Vagococcus lutrae]|nr:hypothetical protein [Vagococcus lutrae]MDT2843021.1 hypothetical protein [Vagococcus lutrae]UQF72100.1 hypothetical protein M2901_10095 [Vagococcus lutrae]
MSQKETRISMMMPKELKEQVEMKAKELGLSFSAYVRMILIKEIKK